MKEIIIESVPRKPKKRVVPKVLNVPDLPLDAPDYDTYLQRINQSQPSENDDTTIPDPRPS